MKHLTKLFFLILFITALGVTAQNTQNYTIKGIVMDSAKNEPIGFSTIIMKDTTANIKAIASESDGKFTLRHNKAGKYTVQISFTGYNSVTKEIELAAEKNVNLGTITLSEGVEIGNVVVIGQLITSDIDKTVYNTTMDPETPSLTALEMMRKVPMLSVDGEDNLKLKDQGNYKILVNGKSNTMMNKNYKEVLRSMPASSIKNIEVITNPPAKYDAEGIAGIINIVTVRKTNNGYNGSVSLRGDQFGGIGGSAYVAASLGKFTFSGNFSIGDYKQPESGGWSETTNEKSEALRFLRTDYSGKGNNISKNLSVDASYEIDTFNLISLAFWGYMGNNTNRNISTAKYYNALGEINQGYENISYNSGSYSSLSGNIDWQRTFMKPDQTLTLSYRMDMGPGNRGYTSDLIGFGGYPDRHQRSDNQSNGGEHTFQVDYNDPLTKEHNIEVGAKFILRPNYSNTINEIFKDEQWVDDPSRKNDLDYLQYIISGYGGYQYKLKKFSVKVGLRAEYTMNTGTFKLVENYNVFNRYFNLVPYITTSYKINDSQTIRLGYTQRLQRPDIWYLNPYVNDQDPTNIGTGNPNLDSEVRHSFNFNYGNYSRKLSLSVNLSASLGNNSIERVTTIRPNGVMFSTYENCGRSQDYSSYIYGNINMLDGKLRFGINANIGYRIVESTYQPELKNSGFNFGGGANFYAQLWKNASANIYASYWSSSVGLQSTSSGQLYTSFNLSQSFLKDKKLRVNLSVSNPFTKNQTYSYDRFGIGYNARSESYYPSRRINLSLQWNFGKMITQVKKARRGINNEDKMSGGGGSSSGGGQ